MWEAAIIGFGDADHVNAVFHVQFFSFAFEFQTLLGVLPIFLGCWHGRCFHLPTQDVLPCSECREAGLGKRLKIAEIASRYCD
jgi:hypothetical protein